MLRTYAPHHHLWVLKAGVPFYACGAPALGSCIVGETGTNIACILGNLSSFQGDLPQTAPSGLSRNNLGCRLPSK